MEQTSTTAEQPHSCKACRKATRTGIGNGCRGSIVETKNKLLDQKLRTNPKDLEEEELLRYLKNLKKSTRGSLHARVREFTDETKGCDKADKTLSRLSQLWEETGSMRTLHSIVRAHEVVEWERQRVSGRESVGRRALKGFNGEERCAVYDKYADVTCYHNVDSLQQKVKDMLSQGSLTGESRQSQLLDITEGIANLETKLSQATEDDNDEPLVQPARKATAFVKKGVLLEQDPTRSAAIDWVCRRVAAGGLPEYKMSEKSER